ncbi:hypothetical protein KGA66_14095 [Actinocrinis puniceicyclus]|uniref:Uncharacterized protein n=1 Tax=Actinocrinis puniceicyclus TaxID=977794 RepID=A0A8J7WKU9_9ACTN|nr:hypothetical protein [Actinocrinis puniceicyclus]MBS2964186.1 hypothetical protein [Actinocrinis puniceicyclus]
MSGCKSGVISTLSASGSPSGAAGAAPSIQPRSAGLLAVHDPKQVTYSLKITSCHFQSGPRPDPHCTPGSFDPSVTQANIHSTICRSGYTATVRPAVSQTNAAKHTLYADYGVPSSTTSELDHLVSLELGGSNDVANLWPEIGKIPNPKDSVENRLHEAVCTGKVTLAAAQQAIATDWTTAEQRLGVK